MDEIAPDTRPQLVVLTPAKDRAGDRPEDLYRLRRVGPLGEVPLSEGDAVVVPGWDEGALEAALERCSLHSGVHLPIIALARDERSGLDALRRGAHEWALDGDVPALERAVRSACARLEARPGRSPSSPVAGNRETGAPGELLNELIGSDASPGRALAFIRELLRRAVDAMPCIDAGSVLLQGGDGRYSFIAAEGYDLGGLRKVTLAPDELSVGGAPDGVPVIRIDDIAFRGVKLDPFRRGRLRSAAGARVRVSLAVPVRLRGELRAVMYLDMLRPGVEPAPEDFRLAEEFGLRLALVLERGDFARELRGARDASLRTVGLLLERRDFETKGHTDRVVAMAERLAEHVGLEGRERQALRFGAYLHDIGKIALPDRLLFKNGRLTDAEFDEVKKHANIGYEMISDLPFLPREARELVLHHHERWNGDGYPHRLTGEEIPVLARLFSMVDVYDALRSRRPYKPAWSREQALQNVRSGAGREFDPDLAHAFLDMMSCPPRGGEPEGATAPVG